jgi:hypothetical protein
MGNLKKFKYEGSSIQFEVIDGKIMANATLMCEAFDKRANDWLALKSTNKYIEAITRKSGFVENQLVTTKTGGVPGQAAQGTWIHERLILNLARWLDVDFEIWCDEKIAELLRTGKTALKTQTEWDIKRYIAKTNYRLQTDAIKENIIPYRRVGKDKEHFIYIDEAEVLNIAVFGMTSREWKKKNPEEAKKGNIRDYADMHQLVVLANMESFNSILINKNIPKEQRMQQLATAAHKELSVFYKQLA